MSEDRRSCLFDAAALTLMFFQSIESQADEREGKDGVGLLPNAIATSALISLPLLNQSLID